MVAQSHSRTVARSHSWTGGQTNKPMDWQTDRDEMQKWRHEFSISLENSLYIKKWLIWRETNHFLLTPSKEGNSVAFCGFFYPNVWGISKNFTCNYCHLQPDKVNCNPQSRPATPHNHQWLNKTTCSPEAICELTKPSITPKATPEPPRPLILCCFSPLCFFTTPVAAIKIELSKWILFSHLCCNVKKYGVNTLDAMEHNTVT
jgi:hypothetical protein